MNIRPAIVLIDDNKILTMRYQYGNEAVFNLPGGNVEFGESIENTLIREMEEELNIKTETKEMICVGEVHLEKKQTLHLIFSGRIISGTPVLNPKETTALEIVWISLNDLTNINLYPNVSKFILNRPENRYVGKIEQKWF